MSISDIWLNSLLAGVAVLIAISFYRMHRKDGNGFNILDLLLENGRVSRIAAAFNVALVATTWVFLKLSIDNRMTEGFFLAYGGMWVAPIIGKLLSTNQVSSSSTTTTTTAQESVVAPKVKK